MYMQALLLLGMGVSTQGFGYLDPPTVVTNKYGTELVYCDYQNVKMLPDSFWRTADCEECECTKSGMFCEGFGFNAGVFGAPTGCDVVNDACDIRLVDAQDDTKDCEPFKQGPPPHLFAPPEGTSFNMEEVHF
ncbi:beta-microseminoprotein-like [Haliotis rufescens]|uniref:beta-microseminoprotein-like n=1 Tax=Haliotis rufescens TaxID=6454 RepID=UPI00201EEB23|nr:beta-microseminoprotein-like [Haliotis rufescens]